MLQIGLAIFRKELHLKHGGMLELRLILPTVDLEVCSLLIRWTIIFGGVALFGS